MMELRCIQCSKLIDRFDHVNGDYHTVRDCQRLTNYSIVLRERPNDFIPKHEKHYLNQPIQTYA